jgi:coatomer protein complex subunit gamma
MLVSLERFFKQALLDNDRHVAAAALATVYHLSTESSDSIRRWSSEIGQYMASGSKSLCQYLALGTLYLSRQADRVGLSKLFQQVSMNSNPNTLVLYIRMYASLMQLSPPITGYT